MLFLSFSSSFISLRVIINYFIICIFITIRFTKSTDSDISIERELQKACSPFGSIHSLSLSLSLSFQIPNRIMDSSSSARRRINAIHSHLVTSSRSSPLIRSNPTAGEFCLGQYLPIILFVSAPIIFVIDSLSFFLYDSDH